MSTTRKNVSVRRDDAPRLLAPDAGEPIDVHALTFEWSDSNAESYLLEVAQDARFQNPIVRVQTGESTSLTAYDLFRPDGSTYYWRVAAEPNSLSEARTFVAGTYPDRRQQDTSIARTTATRPHTRTTIEAHEEAAAASAIGATTRGQMAGVLIIMVASFALTVAIIFHFSGQF